MPRKKKTQLYSKGDLNKIIDSTLHPLTRREPSLWIIDGLFHAALEQDPEMSLRKFIRYNLPKILQQYAKYSNAKRKRR